MYVVQLCTLLPSCHHSCPFQGSHDELEEHLQMCKFEGVKVSALFPNYFKLHGQNEGKCGVEEHWNESSSPVQSYKDYPHCS